MGERKTDPHDDNLESQAVARVPAGTGIMFVTHGFGVAGSDAVAEICD